jgi:hypothetical protein
MHIHIQQGLIKLSYRSTCAGEGKPPMLSHIRVSRGPLGDALVRTGSEETTGGGGGGGDATGRISNLIKSPSYQHKMLHASQFHGNVHNPSSYYQSFGQYISQNPIYPVARVHMKGDPRRSPGNINNGHHVELLPFPEADASADSGSLDDTEDQDPTFSPYIGPSEFAASAC